MSARGTVATFGEFARNGLGVPVLVMVVLAMMVLPLPAFLLDVFFTFNISLSIMILLAVIYVRRALEFATFPTVLLGATLLRLGLNVASTRIVLINGHTGAHAAGHVIAAFGQFVVGGNYAVGMVVFTVLVIINFVVITKGAGRISEVSARFTLDAMPGRQMAIDADLNAGIITQAEAIMRRQEVREEADFYGAMDGASKFVRGDAIAGILIVFINLFGGTIIGAAQHGMSLADAGRTYALLTIGDGLVAQIPALLLSVAVAILVTRVSRPHDMSQQIMAQVLGAATRAWRHQRHPGAARHHSGHAEFRIPGDGFGLRRRRLLFEQADDAQSGGCRGARRSASGIHRSTRNCPGMMSRRSISSASRSAIA